MMDDDSNDTPTTTTMADARDGGSDQVASEEQQESLPEEHVQLMIDACSKGDLHTIQNLLSIHPLYAIQQLESTGQSPLMAAAMAGNLGLCQLLLEEGNAPWNAVDRQGQCAGNYATDHQRWSVVNLLVDWGVRSELILGQIERSQRKSNTEPVSSSSAEDQEEQERQDIPVELQPSTKPDYLQQRLQYTFTTDDHDYDGRHPALLDADNDAVMMEWERPIMQAHAQILMERDDGTTTEDATSSVTTGANGEDSKKVGKSVLNVGFGMGIIDTALQEWNPSLHIIIEAHPDVYQRMLQYRWDQKPNVRICFAKWQDAMPQLISEGIIVDSIFYDTYGEHYLDLEDFHEQMVQLLAKPHGIYSFFNGLAPDNLFFHGVACQCVKLQLAQLGLDGEFYPCQIETLNDHVWDGIRRKYWHGRDTYYLPRFTWNAHYLETGEIVTPLFESESVRKSKLEEDADSTTKRQRRVE